MSDDQIQNILIQIENIGSELGHVMRQVNLLTKWRNVIESQGEKIKSLQENLGRCVHFDVIQSNERTHILWHQGAENLINEIQRRISHLETADRGIPDPSYIKLRTENNSLRDEVKQLQDQLNRQANQYQFTIDNLKTELKHYQNYVPGVCL